AAIVADAAVDVLAPAKLTGGGELAQANVHADGAGTVADGDDVALAVDGDVPPGAAGAVVARPEEGAVSGGAADGELLEIVDADERGVAAGVPRDRGDATAGVREHLDPQRIAAGVRIGEEGLGGVARADAEADDHGLGGDLEAGPEGIDV